MKISTIPETNDGCLKRRLSKNNNKTIKTEKKSTKKERKNPKKWEKLGGGGFTYSATVLNLFSLSGLRDNWDPDSARRTKPNQTRSHQIAKVVRIRIRILITVSASSSTQSAAGV